jgi:D-beta-D-heptose 7-phosphate kinase/D-beta-D-heptose 1-phosphate adenosyltransferase
MKIVLVTGGFDPIHSGHIDYFNSAKELGDRLVVGLNSDSWLERKKGQAFMPITERVCIIENLKMVDNVILFNDNDNTAIEAIRNVQMLYPDDQIIFANGGDRTATNIPELSVPNVIFKFGVGGNSKKNSSSWILNNWLGERVKRIWGEWRVLSQINNTVKTKELIVQPGQKLSMQRHKHRTEFWFVAQGKARVHWDMGYTDIKPLGTIKIHANEWHQLENIGSNILHVVEIQHGESCEESDIERVDN